MTPDAATAPPSPLATDAPAPPARPGEDAATREPAFADLLAGPSPPPAPPPAATRVADADTATAPETAAPGQLLALLDSAWAGLRAPAANDAATATAGPAAQAASSTPAPVAAGAQTTLASAASAPDAHHGAAALDAAAMADATGQPTRAAANAAAHEEAGAAFSIEATSAPPAAAGATAVQRMQAAPAAPPAQPPLAMPADPAQGFDEGFGTRLVWMAEQRLGHAEIRLNPEHVGPIEVRVELDGEQVRAEFHSAHAEVRQAIEASLPRLRELLGQHGLQLGQADVGQGQAGDGQSARGNPGTATTDAETSAGSQAATIVQRRGLLDEYA